MATGDTTALLRSIRRHTGIPDTHPTYSDEALLTDATEEHHSYLLPLGMVERQELWAGPAGRIALPLEDGVARYTIPARAVGIKLRGIELADRQGNPVHLNWGERDEVARWRPEYGIPHTAVVEGNTFRLYPTPRNLAGYTLTAAIYLRPSALVVPAACATLEEAVEGEEGSTTLTVARTDENDALFSADTLDVVSASAPFETLAVGAVVVSTASVGSGLWEVVLDGDFEASAGDYLCLAETAPVVQAPLEWHPLLAKKVAERELAALGDHGAAAVQAGQAKEKERSASVLVRPRREDVPRKVRNGMDRWRGGGYGY